LKAKRLQTSAELKKKIVFSIPVAVILTNDYNTDIIAIKTQMILALHRSVKKSTNTKTIL